MDKQNRSLTILLLFFAIMTLGVSGVIAQEGNQPTSPNTTAENLSAGFDGLVVGVPGEAIGAIDSAGAVNVLFGRPAGLTDSDNQIWNQDSAGIAGSPESFDNFGRSVASGDFNSDGFVDLAAGVPGESIGALDNAGAVNIIYGQSAGFTSAGNQIWSQDSTGIAGVPEANDDFGFSVATGDFNSDGFLDLAVGVPGEAVGALDDAGAVNVIYGGASGLTEIGNQIWSQDSAGIAGVPEANDDFGQSLTTGDFNGDGYIDLAVGVPGEAVGALDNAGAVNVLYGSASGLTGSGNQIWSQDSAGIAGVPEADDDFGQSLATGDFNRDGYADLAVGVSGEAVGALDNAGAVNIIYGSAAGLTDAGNQIWSQDSAGIAGVPEASDLFGFSVAAGDFNGDGYADLAAGVTGEAIGALTGAGAVNVLYGSAAGLTSAGNQIWSQDSAGIAGVPEAFDFFGVSVAAGDFNGDGYADLAAGVTGEAIGAINNAGAVNVIYGGAAGLVSAGNQIWSQDSAGIVGVPETNDLFGFSVAVLPSQNHLAYLPVILRP